MNSNIDFEYKFKLGQVVWLKAKETKYLDCKNCKSVSVLKKDVVKIIKAKVVSINVSCSIMSSPDVSAMVLYSVKSGDKLMPNCREVDLFINKNEAKAHHSPMYVYGI